MQAAEHAQQPQGVAERPYSPAYRASAAQLCSCWPPEGVCALSTLYDPLKISCNEQMKDLLG